MKKLLLSVFIISALISLQTPAAASVPIESTAQYEAQISFFKEALDHFGATDPDQAVQLWVKGDETRNGVYKYAVGSEKIKQWLISRWGTPDKNFWIIGVSSPWLTSHDIVSKKTVSPTEIKYTVKYHWATSAGPAAPTTEHLTVTKEKDLWRISSVHPIGGIY